MSIAAVARVGAAHGELSAMLDRGSPAEIEAAIATLTRALETLNAVGAWHANPDLKESVSEALRAGEGARVRTRYLAEHGRNRLARLLALKGRAPVGYGRNGRDRGI